MQAKAARERAERDAKAKAAADAAAAARAAKAVVDDPRAIGKDAPIILLDREFKSDGKAADDEDSDDEGDGKAGKESKDSGKPVRLGAVGCDLRCPDSLCCVLIRSNSCSGCGHAV